jgi:hypothetical protein
VEGVVMIALKKALAEKLFFQEEWLALHLLLERQQDPHLTKYMKSWYNEVYEIRLIDFQLVFVDMAGRLPEFPDWERAKKLLGGGEMGKEMMRAYVSKAQEIIKEALAIQELGEKIIKRQKALAKIEKDFIQELEDMGIQSLTLTDGSTLTVVEKYHCNINKNLADKDNVAFWLRENGAEDLVSSVIEMQHDEFTVEVLEENGLAFVEKVDMNTSKVKAFIKEGLGLTGAITQFEITDLPKGLHFFIDKEIQVE